MTRTTITKLTATALAVASLGLASTAQAAEQKIAIGEPVPGSGVPTQPEKPTGGDGDYHGPEDGSQASPPKVIVDYYSCKQLQEKGYKIACKDPHKPYPKPRPHPKPNPKPYPEPEKPQYEKPTYQKAEEPSKGELPFTGLEIWQLGAIGIVLVGGGLGARRLLVA